MDITSKSAYKLLHQLESDPQLQSVEDTTILNDEQYPIAFESSITNLKEIIPLVSAVTILRWDANTDSVNLTKDQIQRMKIQKQKAIQNLSLNPTVDNPWDKIKFNFWKDRITNICLGAAQAAFQTHEDSSNLKFLFSASDKSNPAIKRGDQRNVQGLILFHPILLQAPWEESSSQDQDILKLLEEKTPLIMARAVTTYTGPAQAHEFQLQQTAKQSIDSMRSSLKLLLARIQKFTSHTFHVFLRDLIPGAKKGRSLLFTRIVEHRNQFLASNRTSLNPKMYSALNTLAFIEANYVQENDNTMHIAWTAILLHTRDLMQPVYQWQASFDPLVRKYEQAKSKSLGKTEFRKLKCLIAKQITDDEKVILAGIDSTFTIENIDKGNYIFRTFQEKLASNASRFQSKKYTPDGRILTYLKVRANDFNVPIPSFMKKRTHEKGKGPQQLKRGRNLAQMSRSRTHNAYLQQSVTVSAPVNPASSSSSNIMLSKGAHKGKGRGIAKGQRHDSTSVATLSPSCGKGYVKGKGSPGAKGKGSSKGKLHKGKGQRVNTGTSLSTLVCGFCHLHGHHESNCRKRHALHNSNTYQQARSHFDSRQQLLMDQLENSLFAPNVCSWCLQRECNTSNCYPPEEQEFYVSTIHLFQETLVPLIQNAKLGLPIDNTAPLMPDHFAFDDADWGRDTESEFVDEQHDESQSISESSWLHPSESNVDHYFQEEEANGHESEYVVEQLELHSNDMDAEEEQYDVLMVNSNGIDGIDVTYDDKFEDEGS